MVEVDLRLTRRRGLCSRALILLSCLTLLVVARPLCAETALGDWRFVRSQEGITSWQSERPAQPLSVFRSQAVLSADVRTALAVLDDVDRACEWTSHCAEMRRLRTVSTEELFVYARIDAPWPVRDRDVVVRVQVSYGAAGELLLSINESDAAGTTRAPSVVRMPRFSAHYRFHALDAQHTRVEYQLDVDPGGTLPDWLKRMIARDLTHDTLADLRARTRWALARGEYQRRAPDLAASARAQGFRAER